MIGLDRLERVRERAGQGGRRALSPLLQPEGWAGCAVGTRSQHGGRARPCLGKSSSLRDVLPA